MEPIIKQEDPSWELAPEEMGMEGGSRVMGERVGHDGGGKSAQPAPGKAA